MLLICFGHKPLEFSVPYPFTFITTRQISGLNATKIDSATSFPKDEYLVLKVSDGDSDKSLRDEVVSEYASIFALARLLVRTDVTEPLYLFHYRKFLSFQLAGVRAENAPYAHLLRRTDMSSAFPSPVELSALEGRVFRGPAFKVKSVARQYAVTHHADDLVLFIVALRERGILTGEQCARFLRADRFVPAPSMGMYPAKMLVRHAAVLRKAWSSFHRSYYVEREGPQRRVGGFMLERLHAFLIEEDIAAGRTASATGHMLVAFDGLAPVLAPGVS